MPSNVRLGRRAGRSLRGERRAGCRREPGVELARLGIPGAPQQAIRRRVHHRACAASKRVHAVQIEIARARHRPGRTQDRADGGVLGAALRDNLFNAARNSAAPIWVVTHTVWRRSDGKGRAARGAPPTLHCSNLARPARRREGFSAPRTKKGGRHVATAAFSLGRSAPVGHMRHSVPHRNNIGVEPPACKSFLGPVGPRGGCDGSICLGSRWRIVWSALQ